MRRTSSGPPGTSRSSRGAASSQASGRTVGSEARPKADPGLSELVWSRIRRILRSASGQPDVVFVLALRRTEVSGRQVWTCTAQGKQFVATASPSRIDDEAVSVAAKTLAEFVGRKIVTPLEGELISRIRDTGIELIGNLMGAAGRRIEGKINGAPPTERSR